MTVFRATALALAALAIAAFAWIGYRATDPANQRYCAWLRYESSAAIMCSDKKASKDSFRLVYVEHGKVGTLP
jgi:hypothetical protein